MKNIAILPSAMILCVDDIGWHSGYDKRYVGEPSRTGMPRKHQPEDYMVLEEIGKQIDMRILCPICMGEWDKNNILRGKIGYTFEPQTWDRASKIDFNVADKCFEVADNSEYIDFCLHGNLHGNYDENGRQITEMEFFEYKNEGDERLSTMPTEKILERIDTFFRIYDSWGFTKPINSFVAPNGIPKYLTNEDLQPLAKALKLSGIDYWTSRWKHTVSDTVLFDGITYMEKNVNFGVTWNAYDVDPGYMKPFAQEGDEVIGDVLGMHWPNFLRFDPQNNFRFIDGWVDYFTSQAEVFGLMLAKDIKFSTAQHLYRKFSKITETDDCITIDVSEALAKNTGCLENVFYVSIKKGVYVDRAEGAEFVVYENKEWHRNYRIKHTENIVKLYIKPTIDLPF